VREHPKQSHQIRHKVWGQMWGGELASLKEPKFFSRLRQNYGNLPLRYLMAAFGPKRTLGHWPLCALSGRLLTHLISPEAAARSGECQGSAVSRQPEESARDRVTATFLAVVRRMRRRRLARVPGKEKRMKAIVVRDRPAMWSRTSRSHGE
jgi:hypothetical protein